MELRAFTDSDLDAAAALLAERHAGHRAAEPLLAEADARAAVEAAWRREGTSGALAARDGEPVAYVLGQERESEIWGRHAWVEKAAHAARDAEAARDAYAAAAEAWVARGIVRHFAQVPATPEALDPWYRLAFAQMHVDGIVATAREPVAWPEGVSVRRAVRADLDAIVATQARVIWQHQARAPSFSELAPPDDARLRADWAESFDEDDPLFVVERGGEVVGHSLLYPPAPEIGTPPAALYLASTATLPDVRGLGVGLALFAHVRAWAHDAGHPALVTNWRVTNLLASRFWPARGFRPTFVRLQRLLGAGG